MSSNPSDSTRYRPSSTSGKGRRRTESVFLDVPYDHEYEPLLLALIAGLCGFNLTSRATIEIPSSQRRLNRIIKLIGQCSYSFHDLSRVTISPKWPRTPRFNMPFELGLAVARAVSSGGKHRWFLFESRPYRLSKSLSDLDGTDPFIHSNKPEGVLRALMNILVQRRDSPTLSELTSIFLELRVAARKLKKDLGDAPLFEARAFRELVFLANGIVFRARA